MGRVSWEEQDRVKFNQPTPTPTPTPEISPFRSPSWWQNPVLNQWWNGKKQQRITYSPFSNQFMGIQPNPMTQYPGGQGIWQPQRNEKQRVTYSPYGFISSTQDPYYAEADRINKGIQYLYRGIGAPRLGFTGYQGPKHYGHKGMSLIPGQWPEDYWEDKRTVRKEFATEKLLRRKALEDQDGDNYYVPYWGGWGGGGRGGGGGYEYKPWQWFFNLLNWRI